MSVSQIVIEDESGTYTGRRHPHNGYHAGDFWTDWHVAGCPGGSCTPVQARRGSHPHPEL